MERFCGEIEKDSSYLGKAAGVGASFDVKERFLFIGGRRAYFCFISSIVSDALVEKFISSLLSASILKDDTVFSFAERSSTIGDLKFFPDGESAASEILEGSGALLVDGFFHAVTVDLKNVPSRGIEEPESDRVLRGSRDGFTERLIDNIALIRQRLKTSAAIYEKVSVGQSARTSVALCYYSGRADMKFVRSLISKLESSKTDALSMSSESLAELLIRRRWYDPFPKVRFTERPDAACAMILEGSVILLCDNSPQAMILPCSVFDFVHETDDFYFPPLVGSYLRLLRFVVFMLSYTLVPVWFLLISNPETVPERLSFILPSHEYELPIILQILLVEFTIDALKLASMNTPGSLSNSLSIVAGLLLGDFAIDVGWLTPEVILYMSFVAMANFTQPSFELGYAFKFMRITVLILTALFNYVGFALGVLVAILSIVLNNSVAGSRGYLYPLIPFDRRAFFRLLFRRRLKEDEKS